MALKKAKNADWQDGVCMPCRRRSYYLHVLLDHVRGATSFVYLKTTGTALNSVHDFLTQYFFMRVVVYFWTRFDIFRLFHWYHI
jgi:hypothetical protein